MSSDSSGRMHLDWLLYYGIYSKCDVRAPLNSVPLFSVDVLEDVPTDNVDGGCEGSNGLLSGPMRPQKGGPLSTRSKFLDDSQLTAISGALAGFLAGVLVCPLDVAKTKLQAQGSVVSTSMVSRKYYHGIFGTLQTILRDEGVRGLYRGVVPIVLGYLPTWTIYFTIYEKSKLGYLSLRHCIPSWNDFFVNSASALTAGAVSTILTNPIWVVKTRLMAQSSNSNLSPEYRYTGTLDAFKKMYKHEGFGAFYLGLVPSLLGLFHVAIHFPVYEELKVLFHAGSMSNTSLHTDSTYQHVSTLHLERLLLASCLSKMIASSLTYPHEILRTRMHVHNCSITSPRLTAEKIGIIKLSRIIYVNEGLMGFYSGFFTNIARTLPASAITLVSFEYVRKYLNIWNQRLY